jgi:hypothetical protein
MEQLFFGRKKGKKLINQNQLFCKQAFNGIFENIKVNFEIK